MKFQEHLQKLLKTTSHQTKKRLVYIFAFIIFLNAVVWILTLLARTKISVLLGLVTIAYSFGLRHAVDADHIAAIDNTTRKLIQDGKRPVGVGFFFSLGHSTIVIVLSLFIAISASFVQHNLPSFRQTGSIIGTALSSFFLIIIGSINLITFVDIFKIWRKVVRGGKYNTVSLDNHLNNRGFLARILKTFLKSVNNSWNMYAIGLLFGLGFDTASEVGILSLSAVSGAKGMPIWTIMLLPFAFTAGMVLIDTLDGVLMLGAYGWAHIKPIRKLYYNMNLTFISVFIALFIGTIEGLQVISQKTGENSGIFRIANSLQFDNLGFIIIGVFASSWIISLAVYKIRKYDLIDSD